jgi:hypothetical protein
MKNMLAEQSNPDIECSAFLNWIFWSNNYGASLPSDGQSPDGWEQGFPRQQ